MAAGLAFNYAAKQVDDKALETFARLAEEMQLAEKFEALYNGEVINTGEKRMVLHHLTRGQLGEAVVADGVDKRGFYVEQQRKIAELANKVHSLIEQRRDHQCRRGEIHHCGADWHRRQRPGPPRHVPCSGELGQGERHL